jgi:phosphoheptose isomerase
VFDPWVQGVLQAHNYHIANEIISYYRYKRLTLDVLSLCLSATKFSVIAGEVSNKKLFQL